jgi:hypothetical protein
LALEFNYLCFLNLVFISGGFFSKWCEKKISVQLVKKSIIYNHLIINRVFRIEL